ncbi:hypothetical protein BS78_05G081800 [Paspalum vaginatum]|nr:hypothetical protein BS78_05G081800 [Paspalum vaginatum]
MLMLSSYSLLSRSPLPLRGNLAATVSLPRVPVSRRQLSSRAPRLFVCRAHKNTHGINHNALVNRSSTVSGGGAWNIMEDNDHIYLKIKLEDSSDKEKLDVKVTEDQELLIKYKDETPGLETASKLDVCLLMPPGYNDKMVTAKVLPAQPGEPGVWLQIAFAKPKLQTFGIKVTP